MKKTFGLTIFFACHFSQVFVSASFVVTTEKSYDGNERKNFGDGEMPRIYEMQIESEISNRFARTLVTSKMQNSNVRAQEATFSVILPDKAFISEFVMVIGGNSYKAYVKEKDEARIIYDQAVASGLGAAHVAATARDSNRFTVSVNVEALGKATFMLKYEELLRLKESKYELVINIHPNQPVKDLYANVMIKESRRLKFVKTTPLRSGNENIKCECDLNPKANIVQLNPTSALIQFKPSLEQQKDFAEHLGTDVAKGLSGQFVVQYDVERDPHGGEVLLQDGYFVHFFAPSELKPLSKFIIFVLDTSESMDGQKLVQLKEAMIEILGQLTPDDYFHIIEFNSDAKVWDVINPEIHRQGEGCVHICGGFPSPASGSPDNIEKAKYIISKLNAQGYTNINQALQKALDVINAEKTANNYAYLPQPIIMFLSDGYASEGVTDGEKIITGFTNRNEEQVPIYSLSFGNSADKNLLKKLSLKNQGFSRHIYEASDAALQLQDFYKVIASPLLSDVKFEYVPDAISLTKTTFPVHFDGSELVVAGKLNTPIFSKLPQVTCTGKNGMVTLQPAIERSVTSLERLWAYLTVRQLLDEKEIAQNKADDERKALDLALKYSFVTPVTSLVVVKPNSLETNTEVEAADKSLQTSSNSRKFGSRKARRRYFAIKQRPTIGNPPGIIDSLTIAPETSVDGYQLRISQGDLQFVNKLSDLKSGLPWLENSLNKNGTLKSPPGGYELGLNETFFYKPSCSETPTNTTGHCELLDDCPQVHHLLTTEGTYLRYFCSFKKPNRKFAGVCCP